MMIQPLILGLLVASTWAEKKETHDPYLSDNTQDGTQEKPSAGTTTSTLRHEFKFAKLLDAKGLKELKEDLSSVGAVFFYKKRMPQTDAFFIEYEKSAGFLGAYGISLGLVDCSAHVKELEGACINASGDKIYTYRHGVELLDLDQDTMFDVNSIMSNILQLALLNEVTIIQSRGNRQILERDSAGQTDIIYSYHTAIGTYEHRVFMEIAYAYHDKYKFILTTEPASTNGLQDFKLIGSKTVCAMWVLYCRVKYDAANGCRSVHYRGEFNLFALANFLKALSLPKMFHYSEDGDVSPCELDDTLACIYITYPSDAKEEARKVIDSIQFDVHGLAGLVVTEVKAEDISTLEPGQKPQLSITKPGKKDERIVMDEKLDWTLENVEYFISTNLFTPSATSSEADSSFHGDFGASADADGQESVEEIDDMVLEVAYQQREKSSDIPHVPALTDKTFPAAVGESKLLVVLFYLPFDARSMVFLLQYQEAALALADLKSDPTAHPLARVSCYDWTDVCQKANITTYPQIHIYRNGGQKQQYNHSLDKDALVRTVRLLQLEQPLMLKTKEEVDDFVGGLQPEGASSMTDNFVLLKPSSSKKEMKAFETVVKSLETQMLFAVVSPDVNTPHLQEAGVLHIRLTDPHQPMEKLTSDLDAESVTAFLQKGQFHLLPELTHINFPALYARQQPFAVLFTSGADDDKQSIQHVIVDIIRTGKFPELIFSKMTVDGVQSMAESILINYTGSMSLPTFAIVKHRQGEVFIIQDTDFTKGALTAWIQGVLYGSVIPTKILEKGEWKHVGSHYDFLHKMDMDQQANSHEPISYSSGSCPSGKCDKSGEMSDVSSQRLKEVEEMDADIRANLLDLQHSRLYSVKERKPHHAPHHAMTQEKSPMSSTSASDMEAEQSHLEGPEGAMDAMSAERKNKPVTHEEL